MCLRFVFLLTTRLAAWLRLSRRRESGTTAEILILRHQLAILQRRQPRRPKLNWADRALLAAPLSVIPKAHRHGLRLLVTPDTILRWHRDIIRHRQAARYATWTSPNPSDSSVARLGYPVAVTALLQITSRVLVRATAVSRDPSAGRGPSHAAIAGLDGRG